MKVFKRKFTEELAKGMVNGECIITKVDGTEYGNFIVHKKTNDRSYPYMGIFPGLGEAISFAQKLESPESKYEYFLVFQDERSEGRNETCMESMGLLSWELCGIDSNIVDNNGRSLYIYKRILYPGIYGIGDKNEPCDFDENTWVAVEEHKTTRKNLSPVVRDFLYTSSGNSYDEEITVHFGKNGLGLTSELSIIGKKIEELSKDGLVYIREAFVDECDDVYSLKFLLKRFKK
jgi:hypothetical protein